MVRRTQGFCTEMASPSLTWTVTLSPTLIAARLTCLPTFTCMVAPSGEPDAELWIAGAPDLENPARYTEAELATWAAQPGVRLVGAITDVPGFWAQVHVACLPSRGGEGLPRSLIEASACARPVVTTDVPGCRQFVIDGETGFVRPPENAEALAAAFMALRDKLLRDRMGAAGRQRVLQGYTTDHVAGLIAAAWRGVRFGR